MVLLPPPPSIVPLTLEPAYSVTWSSPPPKLMLPVTVPPLWLKNTMLLLPALPIALALPPFAPVWMLPWLSTVLFKLGSVTWSWNQMAGALLERMVP